MLKMASADWKIPADHLTVQDGVIRALGQPSRKVSYAELVGGKRFGARLQWMDPGDNWGQEFVYPKKKALELAKITNLPVLYIPDEVAPNIVAPATTAAEPPVVALKEAPVMAVKPTGETVAVAEVVEPPPVQTAAKLPKTASDLPLVALMGFLCLGIGISMRQLCGR